MSKPEKHNADRREFLKKVGTAGAAAAGAALVSGQVQAGSETEVVESTKASGYRETDHIKTYYQTLRS